MAVRKAILLAIILGWSGQILAQSATRALTAQCFQNKPPSPATAPKAPIPFAAKPASIPPPAPVPAQATIPPSPVARPPFADPWDILEKTTLSIDYKDQPLEQVFSDLRQRLQINLVVYWPSLRLADIEPDQPVTLKLDRVPAAKVLGAVLLHVSAGKRLPLDYHIDSAVVEVNRRDLIIERQTVQVYSVADLLQSRSEALNSRLGLGGSSGSFGAGTNSGGSGAAASKASF